MDNEKVEALMQEMDIQRKALERAREMVEAIYQEKQEKPAETEEDWIRANLKEGELVEVRDSNMDWQVREFQRAAHNSNLFFVKGAAQDDPIDWQHARLPRNRWLPHLGGECPVPGWMKKVDLAFADGEFRKGVRGKCLVWCWDGLGPTYRIIAYRIPEDQ